jgi:hypothetical protein
MVKEAKFFRKQADKAEQAASRISDPDTSDNLRALAAAYRSRAEAIKRNKRKQKKPQR